MNKHTYVNWETLELVVVGPYDYPIDLERCNDAAGVLDAIFQVTTKTWCSPDITKALLREFDDASRKKFGHDIQGVFCPDGKNQKANWRTGVCHRSKKA